MGTISSSITFDKKHYQKTHFLAISSYFGYLMALYGPLEDPRGALACEFFLFHVLLLNVLETRPAPRFFTNLLRKSKRLQGKKSQIWPFFDSAAHP